MAAIRKFSVQVPESHAKRIEEIEGRGLDEIVHGLVMNWFADERRRDIPVKRQGVSWSRAVYSALLKHVGVGGISRFIREAVYEDLSRTEKDLFAVPDWKEGREEKKNAKLVRDSPPDRLAVQAPIIFPAQWIERIEVHHPGKVSTYIKAVTQLRLEKTYKIELPVQKGMGAFLNR